MVLYQRGCGSELSFFSLISSPIQVRHVSLSFQRRKAMPHIIVKLWPGHSEEQKAQLAERLVKDGVEVLGKGADHFSVGIEEVSREEWAEKVYKPEILKNLDKLYKKPGYKM
jgi:4-oxalocrotonate tautomerase